MRDNRPRGRVITLRLGRSNLKAASEALAALDERCHATWVRAAENVRKARAGDPDAIVSVIAVHGIEALKDAEIVEQIGKLDSSNPTHYESLDRILDALRQSMLQPRLRGRRAWIPRATVDLVAVVQDSYERHRTRLKPVYRNDYIRRIEIKEVSHHIASAVPLEFQPAIEQAVERRLQRSKGRARDGFATEVVAEACSCSSRQLRSLMRRG